MLGNFFFLILRRKTDTLQRVICCMFLNKNLNIALYEFERVN